MHGRSFVVRGLHIRNELEAQVMDARSACESTVQRVRPYLNEQNIPEQCAIQ